ncbi:hypothetical protein CDAR_213591 [Caerostris darwini]|uniref:Uncharacterized protein n=1 Tax=Caerostris darwini TaxID=1538125 RepID=A0AAV4T7L5_9ARAC|nr:hypothetical protein CDAR_213591 [Caerostris darwini]
MQMSLGETYGNNNRICFPFGMNVSSWLYSLPIMFPVQGYYNFIQESSGSGESSSVHCPGMGPRRCYRVAEFQIVANKRTRADCSIIVGIPDKTA